MKICNEEIRPTVVIATASILAVYLFISYIGYIMLLATLVNLYNRKVGLVKYLINVALAMDDVLGTIIYWTRRHTLSANIGYRAYNKNKLHVLIAKVVDFIFGRNHCYCTAIQEGLIND